MKGGAYVFLETKAFHIATTVFIPYVLYFSWDINLTLFSFIFKHKEMVSNTSTFHACNTIYS